MKLHIYILLVLLLMEGLQSCISPFMPEGLDTSGGTLVVEGDILANDTTKVWLSYSLALDDDHQITYETDAKVWVESETGIQYTGELSADSKASYFAINTTNLDLATQYKLCVQLSNGKSYASDLMPVLIAPPIDSINYIVNDTRSEVTFYVNAHGADNDSRYYKWQYLEDWEFTSYYRAFSYYDPDTDEILPLPDAQNTFYCWESSPSTDILVAQTADLGENVVHRMKVVSFTNTDRRASHLYAIMVHQLSISPEAYKYWSTLKKNSDEIGGIFAPQPSEMSGNIHCLSDPDERVLGYISASTVVSKRIFVSGKELMMYRSPFSCAVYDSMPTSNLDLYKMGFRVIEVDLMSGQIYWGQEVCVDCRYYGSKNKPSFWPNDHQ